MGESRTASMCAAYRRGEPVAAIADRFGVQNPAVYKALRRGGVLPPYQPKQDRGRGRPIGGGNPGYTAKRIAASADAIAKREERLPPVPVGTVDRDACFYCGIRGDIGCQHRPAP